MASFIAMGVVFAVNGYFIYAAVNTFPGAAGTDGFDLSNGYDQVLATAAQQAALGWQVEAQSIDAGHPLLLADRPAAPLPARRSTRRRSGRSARPKPRADLPPARPRPVAVRRAVGVRPVGFMMAVTIRGRPLYAPLGASSSNDAMSTTVALARSI